MKLILLFCGLAIYSLSFGQDTARADAAIKEATVYFGYGAELTHEAKVKASTDTRFIIIDKLSNNIDINSLQVSCPEDMTLLSQRYMIYHPPVNIPEKSRQVIIWEDSIDIIQKNIQRINNQISIEDEILKKTGILIESTIANAGNKTVASADLLKLIEYYNARIEKSKNNIYNYRVQVVAEEFRIAGLRKKINEFNTGTAIIRQPSAGRIILQVICNKSTEMPVSLSYYTHNAGWTPLYDIRVNSKTNKVKLVYKASLTQTTGIAWTRTKITLSTGTPNFGVTAPVLNPWALQLYVPGLYTELQRRAAVANNSRNRIQSYNDDKAAKEEIVANGYGIELERKLDNVEPTTIEQFTTLNEGQLNTNFEIDLPYNIESDGMVHSVAIKEQEIGSILKNYAVPRMDKEAYLLAEVADWQNLDLLPGDANIIMDDTYIGKSIIDPNTTADTLNIPLGKDKRISVKRTMVKEMSSLKTSGNTTRQVFTYEVTVKNNKLTDVNLLLKDQFPLSTIKEIEVTLDESGNAMVNHEAGVLTWKIDLKPGESRKVRFTYSVRYPKDKKIINLK